MRDLAIDRQAREVYALPSVVDFYENAPWFFEPERVLLEYLEPRLKNLPILEIGVGAGRLTARLLSISSAYVGIDFSLPMVRRCRQRFPGVEFHVCDARDLRPFERESFDLVFFSFNGIDHAGHDDRILILNEIRRVLRRGGQLVFSSHNLATRLPSPFRPPAWSFRRGAFRGNLRSTVGYLKGVVNHLRNRRHQRGNPDYAIINDRAHDYRTSMYYTTIEHQYRQLAELGFRDVRSVGLDGAFVAPGDPCEDCWIYYLAAKSQAAERSGSDAGGEADVRL